MQKAFTFLLVTMFSVGLFAQIPGQQPAAPAPADYSDEELQQFANAVMQVMVIQEESQMQMVNVIEQNNISVDRFNEMLMESQQQGPENIDASEEELAAFNQSMTDVQNMQMEMQEDMMEAIADTGLEVDTYQNIMQAYEQNPEIKTRVDAIMEDME